MSTMTIERTPAAQTAETGMQGDRFVYVTYIRTTPAMLWDALRKSEFTRDYWFGTALESTWKTGASWAALMPDGRLNTEGTVLECDPMKRLVLSWQPRINPTMAAEGEARCTFELETRGDTVKLTVIHESGRAGSATIAMVSTGWPLVLANLKSLLETGDVPAGTAGWAVRCG
jgi:uncharacterized protein YndB with AHSA1/START domain